MRPVSRKWLLLFGAVLFLVVGQVAWWNVVFLDNVAVIADLKRERAALRAATDPSATADNPEAFEKEAYHRRVMFVSESAFFVVLAGIGFYLLFRSLKAEERSRETERNFIEIVSHESKTPLTALKLRLEAVAARFPEAAADLRLALDEVRRLSSLLEKVLTLNRTERQALAFEPLYVADVVEEVVRRLDPLLKSKSVELSLDLDPSAVVRGDVHGLQNTIQSLVENAVFYHDKETKRVSVQLRQEGGRVWVEIADDGPGIDEEERGRVFERFYRGNRGRRIPGTGLGLFIARRIVEAHQGAIRLMPSRPGLAGSRFRIDLPATGA